VLASGAKTGTHTGPADVRRSGKGNPIMEETEVEGYHWPRGQELNPLWEFVASEKFTCKVKQVFPMRKHSIGLLRLSKPQTQAL